MAQKDLQPDLLNQLLDKLERLVGKVEFGSIELVFHQGKLVQLEKNEKLRLDKPAA
ncbi:YezD family protein [Rheinheimera sp.]|uniref:YezD family protein n=1 Tax=Rheinheimera sp. TaxID=1869214 RepID=UPI00307F0DC4